MSFSENMVILFGNVGQEPKVKETQTGKLVCRFGLATEHSFKKNDEWKSETTWHNIVCWGKLAERMEKFLKKGMKLYVRGAIRTSKYTDKEGVERTSYSIFANQVLFGSKPTAVDRSDDGEEGDLPPF